ncbi:MAG: mannosyltransferase [Bacteroidetes bacterium]|nr:mannosyltransferase [Bacteroidota bacterium]MBS1756843.1 mannosyltransferase [Bacteroidota bacterium]
MDKHLHIISFDVPYPADYGGVIDVFYKLVALYEAGIKIHLHCFTKARLPQNELNKYCVAVYYYKRKKSMPGNVPYIVQSRVDKQLLARLLQDDYPILMEGIHCTGFLRNIQLKNRIKVVRLHNVEHKYYASLADAENSFLKKSFFKRESTLLKMYEKAISSQAVFAALNKEDKEYYEKVFLAKQVNLIPVFLPWKAVNISAGKGKYCLYHGNLSVIENEMAAIWLIENVFKLLPVPLIIAGKAPTKKLEKIVEKYSNITLINTPDDAAMQALITGAQINILPSFNSTGVKLKLLNALFNGRHCMVNMSAVAGTELATVCTIAATAEDFKLQVQKLFEQNFSETDISKRKETLSPLYHQSIQTKALIGLLY